MRIRWFFYFNFFVRTSTSVNMLFLFQWFNLNSLLTGPELISDTYLALFLAQLQQEGTSPDWCIQYISLYLSSSLKKLTDGQCAQVIPYLWLEETCQSVKQSRFLQSWECINSSGPGSLEKKRARQAQGKCIVSMAQNKKNQTSLFKVVFCFK